MIRLPPQFLSPRELATAIGASESTLKRWIDDGRLQVVRTAGGHRRIPLSEAIRFIRDQRLRVVDGSVLGLGRDAEGPRLPSSDDARIHEILAAGDANRLRAALAALMLAGHSVAALCDGPLSRAMRRIGELWTGGEHGIEIEHLATDCCIQAMQHLRAYLSDPGPAAPLALGCGPSSDPYLLPPTMAATCLAEAGFRTINLGPETPMNVLRLGIERHRPSLVFMAFSTETSPVDDCLEQLDELAGATGLPIVVGGRIFHDRPAPRGRLHHATNMSELGGFARGIAAALAPRGA
jgi:excisionase family DNA binding protein